MTETVQKAQFSFEGYIIERAQIEVNNIKQSDNISFGFAPKGIINMIEKSFQLSLGVNVFDANKSFNLSVSVIANFKFEDEGKNTEFILENFFYINAPAIIFPYIRAYISTLSTLSGIPTILLPTINMSGLYDELKINTTKIQN